MSEIWRFIPGYKGYYEISNYGNVKSCIRTISQTHPRNKTLKQKRTLKSHILKSYISKNGYYYVILCKKGKYKHLSIARLVLTVFDRFPHKREEACHHPLSDKSINTIDNLIWALPKINAQHKKMQGTHYIGAKHHNAKLTEKQAIELIRLSKIKSLAELSILFNIAKQTVWKIKTGKTWSHLNRN